MDVSCPICSRLKVANNDLLTVYIQSILVPFIDATLHNLGSLSLSTSENAPLPNAIASTSSNDLTHDLDDSEAPSGLSGEDEAAELSPPKLCTSASLPDAESQPLLDVIVQEVKDLGALQVSKQWTWALLCRPIDGGHRVRAAVNLAKTQAYDRLSGDRINLARFEPEELVGRRLTLVEYTKKARSDKVSSAILHIEEMRIDTAVRVAPGEQAQTSSSHASRYRAMDPPPAPSIHRPTGPATALGATVYRSPQRCTYPSDNLRPSPPRKRPKQGGLVYHEVQRNRGLREQMTAAECSCCSAWHADLTQLMPPRCGHTVSKEHLAVQSRHRYNQLPSATPQGYWDVNFPPTQQSK